MKILITLSKEDILCAIENYVSERGWEVVDKVDLEIKPATQGDGPYPGTPATLSATVSVKKSV